MPQQKNKLLSTTEAAELLGMSPKQFRRIADCIPLAFPRTQGKRVGVVAAGESRKQGGKAWGHRRYWLFDVLKWIDDQRQQAGSAHG